MADGAYKSLELGGLGGIYVADTSVRNGTFGCILALTACVVNTMTSSNITGTLTAVSIPAGTRVYGKFSSVTLTSGTCIIYNL